MKLLNNLLFRIFLAILIGILIGIYAPLWANRILVTFNKLFGGFLSFSIPLIIMGLVMPAISELGKNAGRLLFLTIIIAYSFTLFSGFSTFFIGNITLPSIIENQLVDSALEPKTTLTEFFRVFCQTFAQFGQH